MVCGHCTLMFLFFSFFSLDCICLVQVMEMYTEELTAQVLQLATLLLAHTSVATRLVLLGNGNGSGIRRPIPSLCKREIERMDCRPSRIWALLAAAESFELSPQVLQPDPDILKEAHNVSASLNFIHKYLIKLYL